MSTHSPFILGPIESGTLLTTDLQASIDAYCDYLDMRVSLRDVVSDTLAASWASPTLAGAEMAILQSASGVGWLRIIAVRQTELGEPLKHYGWIALEICCTDVDRLYQRINTAASPFRIIGKPANLDVSDDIRAMQVVGPANEVLYLTQIKNPVPPFQLPSARSFVDHLFISVLSTPDRARAVTFYEQIARAQALQFDTKITVVNRAFARPIEQKYPVATLQLGGNSLIEIDQIDAAKKAPKAKGMLPASISIISMGCANLDALNIDWCATPQSLDDAPYHGRRAGLCVGGAGELVELIEYPADTTL